MEKNQKNTAGSQKPWKVKDTKEKKNKLPRGLRIALFCLLGLVLLLVIAGVTVGLMANHYMDKEPEQRADTGKLSADPSMFDTQGELPEIENAVGRKQGFYNILIIGRDKVALNTDVMICASFDITNNRAATVQIPRDSYVKDKDGNTSKINAVFARGYTAARRELNRLKQNAAGKTDAELADLCENSSLDIDVSTLSDFLSGKKKQDELCSHYGMKTLQEVISRTFGIYFDYYAIISTDAFVKIVDAVGGVDVYVQQNMDYEDPEQDLYIHIKQGQQHLNGKQAEGFVRFRSGYVQADIARLDAQKIFLTAFFKKLLSFSSITRVNEIVQTVYDCVLTDMSLENALGFVKPALGVDLGSITMLNMQGTPYRNGMYYSLNKAENLKIVNEHFNIFTHPLSANAVQVEELVQSAASDGEGAKGSTMEDISENQPDLGFIRKGSSGSSSGAAMGSPAVSHSGTGAQTEENPGTSEVHHPEDVTVIEKEPEISDPLTGEAPSGETGDSSAEPPAEQEPTAPAGNPSETELVGSEDVPPPAAA